jgi:hypothetical protein
MSSAAHVVAQQLFVDGHRSRRSFARGNDR